MTLMARLFWNHVWYIHLFKNRKTSHHLHSFWLYNWVEMHWGENGHARPTSFIYVCLILRVILAFLINHKTSFKDTIILRSTLAQLQNWKCSLACENVKSTRNIFVIFKKWAVAVLFLANLGYGYPDQTPIALTNQPNRSAAIMILV